MKISKKTIIIVGAILIALIAVYLGAQAYAAYKTPLGPALSLATRTSLSVPPTSAVTAAPGVTVSPLPSSTTAPTFTPGPQPLCGGPPLMNILGIGSDARGNHYLYGLSDVMRLIRVDFVTPRVTILEIPRDMWVEIPDISAHYGITHGKLNQAYLYGNPGLGYYDGAGQGPELLAKTLALNFGVQTDHYLAVNMVTFTAIIDDLGGLDLTLPYPVDARTADNPKAPSYTAGAHHMDGATALMLARLRPVNTFGRADSQNIVMCALRKKLLSPNTVTRIPQMIDTFKKYVQTDFSPEQISQLACLMPQISRQNITFASFPEDIFHRSRMYDPTLKKETFIFDVDFNVLRDYIAQFQRGDWPPIEDGALPTSDVGEYTCPDE